MDAKFKSFRVTPQTVDDLDKLLSGAHIPRFMKIREWIYYRKTSKPNSNSDAGRPKMTPSSNSAQSGERIPVNSAQTDERIPVNSAQ